MMFFSFGNKKGSKKEKSAKNNSPKRILIVDDDPEILAYSQKCLFRHFENIVVLIAFDGQEALAKVKSENPDLIVLDVKMPGMDGLQAFNAIIDMQLDHPPKTLAISGFSEKMGEMRELGVDAILPKPYSPAQLAGSIEALLDIQATR